MVGPYGPLYLLVAIGLLVPNIAVSVRRLHDTNRSGWWILMPAIPYCLAFVLGGAAMLNGAASGGTAGMMAGMGVAAVFLIIGFACAVLLLVFYCLPGTPGDNRYGANPYGEGGGNTVPAA